ncbi:glycoside hydrolase family 99-like domain-containing protein [Piscinibacter sakaiensis]|uniref:glycosyltransferase WbsX family protein n=1 Tax=Piscinibacter sakaiensis TaxID=1547922 RepID=UPI003AB0E888
MTSRLLSLAFYLPQFHPIPENDEWWGSGFTEWTAMERAQAWYPGHRVRQPVPPLGRYDLLDPAVIQAQHALARSHGIDGFLIWNYWFGGGRQLLERPLQMVLEQRLQCDYALAWANHDWVDKRNKRVLMKQSYPGRRDIEAYFHHCLPHFRSDHYIRVDGKPFFFIYRPQALPDLPLFLSTWRTLAAEHGLPGLFFAADLLQQQDRPPPGLDAWSCSAGFWQAHKWRNPGFLRQSLARRLGLPSLPPRFDFSTLLRNAIPASADEQFLPTVFTGWDTTPRHGRDGMIVDGLTPASFRGHLEQVKAQLLRQHGTTRIVLVKSWNEWAEGNLLEPDSIHGESLLHEYRRFVENCRAALAAETVATAELAVRR